MVRFSTECRIIRRKKNSLRGQWELKISKLHKARENDGDQVVIGVSFVPDWMREWCEFSGPITKQSKTKAIPEYFGLSVKVSQNTYYAFYSVINLLFPTLCLFSKWLKTKRVWLVFTLFSREFQCHERTVVKIQAPFTASIALSFQPRKQLIVSVICYELCFKWPQ